MTVDITGSEGASFAGPVDSRSLTKTTVIPAFGRSQVGTIELKGDWELKIKFTYTVEKIAAADSDKIKLEANKKKQVQEQAPEEGSYDEVSSRLASNRKIFDKFAFDSAAVAEI